jgi:hypothetical protein
MLLTRVNNALMLAKLLGVVVWIPLIMSGVSLGLVAIDTCIELL